MSELEALIGDARQIANDVRSSFGKLSASQLNWKPSAERWSVAQCLDHLIASNNGYFPIIESVRSGTKKSRFLERLPVLPGLAGKLLVKSLDPASTRKLKAPKSFEPARSDIAPTIVEDFVAQQEKVVEGMKATSDRDLEHIIVTSPALSIVTYSLMDAYRIIVVHEKRHVKQVKRVTGETTFPRSM
jgi:hypothetical protein